MSDAALHMDCVSAARGADVRHGTAPLLAARGLGFTVGGQALVSDVDLTIGEGRKVVIMGANGAGKSLLLRLLHGLLTPTSGALDWCGGRMDTAARRQQAMVFQRPVMMRRSVAANLRFALSVRGLRGAGRRMQEEKALALSGLCALRDRPARVLSGGEQQRLAVARALACTPRLMLLDEPTASLDPAATHAVERLIVQAQTEGVTTVTVTHDAGQARRLGDHLVFMNAGRIMESGPVEHLLDNPRSDALRAWLDGRLYLTP